MSHLPNKTRNIRQVFFAWMLAVSFFAIALLTGYGLWIQYRNFHQDVELIRHQFENEQKKVLQDKVNEAITYARYKAQTTEDRLKEEIKSRTYEGLQIAEHLYSIHSDKKSKEEIKRLIKESLRPIRYKEGRGYFFIVSMDGVEELYPTRPELEGVNLWDHQDIKGNYVIRSEVEIAREKGEGFVTGYWPNPMIKDDPGSLEYSYVIHFPQLDWLIGTGEFLDNVRQEVQDETLNWLARIRYGNGSYIFIETYDGDALLMDGKRVSPVQNVWDLQDPNGVYVIQEEVRLAKENKEGGFLSYLWYYPEKKQSVPVISFVRSIPEWEWVVGSSLSLDDINRAVKEQRDNLRKNVNLHILLILIGMVLSIPLVLLAAYYGARKFDREFQVFLTYFRDEGNISTDIPTERFFLKEFKILAASINTMINYRRDAERKLKILSRTDPLTGIANRREMKVRMTIERARSARNKSPIGFILIDIDRFKSINDQWGHDVGDMVLRDFTKLLKGQVRLHDLLCRWGGEEFLVLAPDTDMPGLLQMAEKIRKSTEEEVFDVDGKEIKITISCGVSVANPGGSLEKAINEADTYLLQGKREGRNRVIGRDEMNNN